MNNIDRIEVGQVHDELTFKVPPKFQPLVAVCTKKPEWSFVLTAVSNGETCFETYQKWSRKHWPEYGTANEQEFEFILAMYQQLCQD